MRLRFRIRTAPSDSGDLVDRVVDVEPAGDEIRIGRRAGVEIQLPFATVSSLHARVFRHGDGWALIDMGSSNGTYVGQTKLASGQPRVIKPGEVFRLADVTVAFEGDAGGTSGADKPGNKSESTATLARRLVNDLFQAVAGAEIARVVVDKGPSAGQSLALSLPDRPYKVGRAPDCDLVLSDDDVSREHAAFERRWQGVYVRDLGSKNGLEIDGKKIRGEQRVHDGELIVLGGSTLRIDDPEERYLRQMEADAREAPRRVTAPPGPPPPGAPSVAPAAAAASRDAAAARPGTAAARPLAAPEPAAKAEPAPASKPSGKDAEADKPKSEAREKKSGEALPVRSKDAGRSSPALPAKAAAARNKTPANKDRAALEAEKSSRALPFFVTLFSLAVLGGVGYLVWVMFFGMESHGR